MLAGERKRSLAHKRNEEKRFPAAWLTLYIMRITKDHMPADWSGLKMQSDTSFPRSWIASCIERNTEN